VNIAGVGFDIVFSGHANPPPTCFTNNSSVNTYGWEETSLAEFLLLSDLSEVFRKGLS